MGVAIQPSQKPHLLKILTPIQKSIVIKGDDIAWNNPWHFHPEIELLYCIKGKGTNFVGNCISGIEEGEILLFGKNLPHTRQRDKDYYLARPSESPSSVVVQFCEEFLGENFFKVQEFQSVATLLKRASRGIKFFGKTRDSVAPRLRKMHELTPVNAILELLSILEELAQSEDYVYLNHIDYVSSAHDKSCEKINKVYNYTIEHFKDKIELSDVATLTNLSPAAFCRYFKTRTRKSYFNYLNEVRIAYACKLLMEGELDISQTCFASGFNNLSHFRKQFKSIVKMTPKEYKDRGARKVPAAVHVLRKTYS